MSKGEFRFSYFTPEYEATLAFYRDGLGFPVLESWDRNVEDRGTLFSAASGIVEVLARPDGAEPAHLWDRRPPQGAFMVIEVDDVDAQYRRAIRRGLSIKKELADQEWGHRGFCLLEPNGLILYFFSVIAGNRE
jgi:catechol 2,3-dioxygenase-like lactoylglutathione lyase family enzyme